VHQRKQVLPRRKELIVLHKLTRCMLKCDDMDMFDEQIANAPQFSICIHKTSPILFCSGITPKVSVTGANHAHHWNPSQED